MELWLLLILLGLFTYFIVKRSVTGITRTPIWILWLVMMTPALIWTGWVLVNGEKTPMPIVLAIAPFAICPVVYWLLVESGRPKNKDPHASQNEAVVSDSQNKNSPGTETNPLAGEQSTVRPISQAEETSLRKCFPWSIYYLEEIEYRPQAVLIRGKLRTNPEAAYKTIQENIEGLFGDRFFVLFQESLTGKPFFALVPNPQRLTSDATTDPETVTRPAVALGLLCVTLFTSTLIGASIGADKPIPSSQVLSNANLLITGLPFAISLIAILGIHEFARYLCAVYYKIRTTLPYFLPVPFFPGTFGAFMQMRSPVPHRKALFDIAIVASVAGFAIAIPLLLWGLAHSDVVKLSDKSAIFNFQSLNPRFSLLLTLLSKLALGSQFAPNYGINLHPVAVAGCIGLLWTAFKLMPIGRLDGGHIVHAMFGQRTGAGIGQVVQLLLLALCLINSFVNKQSDSLLWFITIFFLFMPIADEPALNDVSELDNRRDFCGLAILALLASIVLPAPSILTTLLHI